MKKASIIVATFNREDVLEQTLNAMLKLSYPSYEIIVVNDASTDRTPQILEKFKKNKKIKIHSLTQNVGPARARNIALEYATGAYIVVMDDDCIPEKNWLKNLLTPFKKGVGATSSFDIYGGGTSTAFSRDALEKTRFFDEDFPYPYREDTDLIFRLLDEHYTIKPAKADFTHIHTPPKTMKEKFRYGYKRIKYHSIDPFLYKKHPKRTKTFLDIRYGFLRNPSADFRVATGMWRNDGTFEFSSPQGITLFKGGGKLGILVTYFLGMSYVGLVKLSRLYGSIKYKKLLL